MEFSLSLGSDSLPDERLHDLSRDLCRALDQEADLNARMLEGRSAPGARGDPLIMAIGLAIVADVSASMILHVVRAFFERSPAVKMEFRREDGVKFVINADHVRPEQIQSTIEAAQRFFSTST